MNETSPVRSNPKTVALACRVTGVLLLVAGPVFGYSIIANDNRHTTKKDPDEVGSINNLWYYSDSAGDSFSCGDSVSLTSVNRSGDVTEGSVETAFLAAMSTWNGISDTRYEFYTSSLSSGQGYAKDCYDELHDVFWYSESNTTTLAVTWQVVPNAYQSYGADILFNAAKDWSTSTGGMSGAYDFQGVATHELGHVLGGDHSQFSDSTMYATISDGSTSARTLTADDEKVTQYLYQSKLILAEESLPSSGTVGDPFTFEIYSIFDGGPSTIKPNGTTLYLDISIVGEAAVEILSSDPLWDDASVYPAGSSIYHLDGSAMTSIHPLITAWTTDPYSDYRWDVSVRVTPQAVGDLEIRWRTNYIDESSNQRNANAAESPWKAFGDLVPRRGDSGITIDQQGFPVRRSVVSIQNANSTPNTPSSPSPSDGAIGVSTSPTLSWSGGDPDGDSVTYDVYLDANDSTPNTLRCDDATTTSCAVSSLSSGTTHYWRVVARDEHGATSSSSVWSFSTASGNSAPNTPGNPSPGDGATGVSTSPTLSWSGGDPDGDSVTYDVYLDANDSTPNTLRCNDATTPSCAVSSLSSGTTHYWRVVARDEHGATSSSSVWSFTTASGGTVGPLVYLNYSVDDDNSGQSSGDDDSVPECGEDIELFVELKNEGSSTATSVTASLSSTDSYFSWLGYNTSASWGDIGGGSTAFNSGSGDFEFHIADSTPNGHLMVFELSIDASNGGPWSDSFSIPIECGGSSCSAPSSLIVSDDTILGRQAYGSCQSISVGPNFAVETGGQLTLISDGVVALGDGVSVDQGGELTVVSAPYPQTVCYMDSACYANNTRAARDHATGNCIPKDDCDILWKCAEGPTTGTCGGGSSDCVLSPGCSDGVQRCSNGFCTAIGNCSDLVKIDGYSPNPTYNQCDCAETSLDPASCP